MQRIHYGDAAYSLGLVFAFSGAEKLYCCVVGVEDVVLSVVVVEMEKNGRGWARREELYRRRFDGGHHLSLTSAEENTRS